MSSGKYFNKGIKALNSPHVGHVVRKTDSVIVVFGSGDDRHDIPKSAIRFVSGNVLVYARIGEIIEKYRASRDETLQVGSNTDFLQATSILQHMKNSTPSRSLTRAFAPAMKSTSVT